MKKNILLEEEIAKIKKLSGINEAAPGPTQWITKLIAQIANTPLSDDVIREFEPLINSGKIAINKNAKKITSIDWANIADDEVELLFRSSELAAVFKQIIKDNNIATDATAVALYSPRFKKIVNGYKKGKGNPISSGSSSAPGSGTGNVTNSGKQAQTFGSGGSSTLPKNASVDEVMKYIDVDPVFSQVLKTKKGSREMVENWIEVNLGDNVSVEAILEKVEPYFQRLQSSPDAKTVTFSKRVDQVINFLSKGKVAYEGGKGAVYWGLGIGLIGVVAGAWTLKEFGGTLLCRLGWDKTNDWFGCNSGGGDQQSTNNNNDGGVDWSKYKPAN